MVKIRMRVKSSADFGTIKDLVLWGGYKDEHREQRAFKRDLRDDGLLEWEHTAEIREVNYLEYLRLEAYTSEGPNVYTALSNPVWI